jgi:hypothetical protein
VCVCVCVCVCGISLCILLVHSKAEHFAAWYWFSVWIFGHLSQPRLKLHLSLSTKCPITMIFLRGHPGVFNGLNLDCPALWRCHFCLLYPGELWMFHYHSACAGCSLYIEELVSTASIPRGILNSWLLLAKAPSWSFPHLIVETEPICEEPS